MIPPLHLVAIGEPAEPYVVGDRPSTCTVTPTAGAMKFRDFVIGHLGGGNSGISPGGGCRGSSFHNEGRAWDWTVDAEKPEEHERVGRLFDWLFSPGPSGEPDEMLRRVGIQEIIWDREIWTTKSKAWRPYQPSGNKTIEHRDHVHFSFGRPGSKAETSFFRWLEQGQPMLPSGPLTQPQGALPKGLPVAVGFVVGLGLSRLWS